MTNTDAQSYRVNTYRGGYRHGRDWMRKSNTPDLTVTLDRQELDSYLIRRHVPSIVGGRETGTWVDPTVNQEYTWAPVGQCPNAWHETEGQGRNGRCPDCPSLTDHVKEGNLTATTVLREVMYRLGLPARQDLLQKSLTTGDQTTHGVLGASVVMQVPGGPKYRITITEL
jgi:hypothetical protein